MFWKFSFLNQGGDMRKLIIAMGALSFFSSMAHAQSSVTLYGQIDNGFQYESGLPVGHKLFSFESGNFDQSRFGLKGTEDLGGGTQAIFRLEAGLDTANGTSQDGSLFARNATVGVKNPVWGTFKMGNFGVDEIAQDSYDVDPQLMQIWSIATLVRGRNWSQAGNGLEYSSPSIHGLTLKGQYDLGNSTSWNEGNSGPNQLGNFTQGRSDGIKAMYTMANAELLAIYDEIRDGNGEFDNVYVNSRSILAGGVFTIGPVKLYTGYQHLSAPDASNLGVYGADGTATALPGGASLPTAVNHEWLGASWQVSPGSALTAAVYHANANNGNGNATLYTLGGTYNLSKRTFLYAEAAYVHNSSTSNIGLDNGYGDPYGANINNDPASNSTSTAPNYGHAQESMTIGILAHF
jgi:predicted porin